MPSRASEFFAELTKAADPFVFLDSLVARQAEEDEYLEFKSGGRMEAELNKIRTYWSEALSGFANNEGGVMLWGLGTDKKDIGSGRKLECAARRDLFSNPRAISQLLKDTLLNGTVDPLTGVVILHFEESPNGPGYVACFVPEGKLKPYRSAVTERYHLRIRDSFVVMPHALLRSLFHPRLSPRLNILVKANRADGYYDFRGVISNAGTATGRELFIVMETDVEVESTWPEQPQWTSNVYTGHQGTSPPGSIGRLRLRAIEPLHPGEADVPLFTCRWRDAGKERINFRFRIFSLDQDPVVMKVPFGRVQLINRESEAIPDEQG